MSDKTPPEAEQEVWPNSPFTPPPAAVLRVFRKIWFGVKSVFYALVALIVLAYCASMWPAWRMSLSDLNFRGIYAAHGRKLGPNNIVDDSLVYEKANQLLQSKFPVGSDASTAIRYLTKLGYRCELQGLDEPGHRCEYVYGDLHPNPILLWPTNTIIWTVVIESSDGIISDLQVGVYVMLFP